MGNIAVSGMQYQSDGSYGRVDFNGAFSASYNNTGVIGTTGETLTAASLGLFSIISVEMPSEDNGYSFDVLGLANGGGFPSVRIQVFQGGAGTTGATSGGTPAGTNSSVSAGTPAGSFVGLAMPVHTHLMSRVTNTEAVTPGTGVSNAFPGFPIGCIESVVATVNAVPDTLVHMIPDGGTPTSGHVAINPATGVMQFLIADNVTSATATYVTATLTATSAGTPEGTFTGVALAPHTHIFAGVALAPHTHTVGAGAGGEVPNGTDLSVNLASVRIVLNGY